MENRISWDHTADVVVIVFGAAGAVAAITAHDHGAVLEKQPAGRHLSTSAMSGEAFICTTDVASAVQCMEHLSRVDEKTGLDRQRGHLCVGGMHHSE